MKHSSRSSLRGVRCCPGRTVAREGENGEGVGDGGDCVESGGGEGREGLVALE